MTIAYTTGQITLTNGSAVVTGVGTGWAVALITGGIIAPQSNGNLLPIESVDTDTHITASTKWTGASGTYDYALVRDTAYLQQLSLNSNMLARLIAELEAGTIYKYDASGDLAGRGSYDDRPKGYSYLVSAGVDEMELYVKASATSGDWSGPFAYGAGPAGPVGPAANVVFEDPETGAPGTDVEMVITGTGTIGDPYHVTFTIPRGTQGLPGQDGTGTGDVVGNGASVDGRVVQYDGVTGKAIKDGGKLVADLVTGAAASAVNRVPLFADATGKSLKDSGVVLGDAASKSTGTAAGTVAAGNDARMVNAGRLDTEDQVLTGGARVTSKDLGTISTGTLTLDTGDRPLQHYTNNGAHTLAPGANGGSFLLDIVNGASAGAITVTGFTKVAGDAFTTTSGQKFRCHVSIGNGGSCLIVQAMQ